MKRSLALKERLQAYQAGKVLFFVLISISDFLPFSFINFLIALSGIFVAFFAYVWPKWS
jgi:hypothetical protein